MTQSAVLAGRLLDIALGHLIRARVVLYESILANKSRISSQDVDTAVAVARRAAHQDYVPPALLTRSLLRRLATAGTAPDGAQADLDEAWEIAERGPMRLHMADIHLHRARLFFREPKYPWDSAKADLAAARKLIEQCGYWRRKEELEDAEAVIR
jgi:hypothetical protein